MTGTLPNGYAYARYEVLGGSPSDVEVAAVGVRTDGGFFMSEALLNDSLCVALRRWYSPRVGHTPPVDQTGCFSRSQRLPTPVLIGFG